MGLQTPPRPISKHEFNIAWKEGKRLMKEIDPKLYDWCNKNDKMMAFQTKLITLFMVCLVIYLIVVVINVI